MSEAPRTGNEPTYDVSHDGGAYSAAPVPADTSVADDEIHLLDLLIILAKRKALIVGLPVLAALLAVGITLLMPNIYTATTKILPPQQNQGMGGLAVLAQLGSAPGMPSAAFKSASDVYVAMLKSRTVADAIIQRFDLVKRYGAGRPSQARSTLAAVTTITASRDGVISIDVDDRDPQLAADIANGFIEELMKLTQVLAVTEASQRRLFFEQQFAQAKKNLANAEIAARQALARGGLVKVDEQGRAVIEATGRLRAQITGKEVQIGAMRIFATDENPEVRMAQRELETMKRELARMEGAAGLTAAVPAGAPAQGMETIRLLRDVKYQETLFEMLARQYELARIEEAKDSSVIQILDKAIVPDHKSKPSRLLIVQATTIIAVVVALAGAFILEAAERARQKPENQQRLRTFLQYLSWRRYPRPR